MDVILALALHILKLLNATEQDPAAPRHAIKTGCSEM
jgi:hypothetical protein